MLKELLDGVHKVGTAQLFVQCGGKGSLSSVDRNLAN